MRIALVSTPFVPVPPPGYGGTELVVGELLEGLTEAGHEVRLYSCGPAPSVPGRAFPERRALLPRPAWPPSPYLESAHAGWASLDILADPYPVDVVHTHCPSSLPWAPLHRGTMVYTVHHPRDEALSTAYGLASGVGFVCISARQRTLLPEVADGAAVVHHGLDARRYRDGGGGGPALFLGRLSRDKGPHLAIDVACRAGCPIVVAGRPHPDDAAYFEAEVRPRLRLPGVSYIGEVEQGAKTRLLGAARALLFPIDWEEPFGLVMIEAMLSGTPVLAVPRGAAPEVIDDGVTGLLRGDADGLVAGLEAVSRGAIDRRRCRERAVRRFGRERMIAGYLDVYRRADRAASAMTAR